MLGLMGNLLKLIWYFVVGLFRSRAALEAEIVVLRHQLNVLRRKAPKRLVFSNCDRFVFYVPLSACTRHSEHLGDRQAGDGHPLASGRVSVVLAMEVARSSRQAKSATRNPPADPRHEPRQPAVGRSPDPRRTPQARHRCGSDLGREIYGKTPETSIARMEDVLAHPRRWNRRNGSLCRPDNFLSAPPSAKVSALRWFGSRSPIPSSKANALAKRIEGWSSSSLYVHNANCCAIH